MQTRYIIEQPDGTLMVGFRPIRKADCPHGRPLPNGKFFVIIPREDINTLRHDPIAYVQAMVNRNAPSD